jgi:hypothetical protein
MDIEGLNFNPNIPGWRFCTCAASEPRNSIPSV